MPKSAEFEDSTPLLSGSAALQERMRTRGHLFFRGLIPTSAVTAVRSQVLRELAAEGWLAPGSDPEAAEPGEPVRREGVDGWWGGYIRIQSLQSFHELAHDNAIVGVIRTLVGSDVLVHPRKIARVTYPNSEFPTPAHQDYPLIQGSADTYTVWVPLGETPQTMGALKLLDASHMTGLKSVIPQHGVGGVGVEVDDDDPRWLTTDYRAGDVLIFHSFTVHWAPTNQDRRLRLSADYRYQALSDPVVAGSLGPHGAPTVPANDFLCRGWSSTASIDIPAGVTLAEISDPFGPLGQPASRLVAP